MARTVPTNQAELVELMRNLADEIESGALEYRGCHVAQYLEHDIMPGGRYSRDTTEMDFEIKIAVKKEEHYKLLRDFVAGV